MKFRQGALVISPVCGQCFDTVGYVTGRTSDTLRTFASGLGGTRKHQRVTVYLLNDVLVTFAL